jgi:hypothetical protein
MPFILRGAFAVTAMIRRKRRVAGPRFRYIVAGERGAVEFVTLAASRRRSATGIELLRSLSCLTTLGRAACLAVLCGAGGFMPVS